jgi:hypothetical protein
MVPSRVRKKALKLCGVSPEMSDFAFELFDITLETSDAALKISNIFSTASSNLELNICHHVVMLQG